MRILDSINDRPLKRIALILTADEAQSLLNQLGKLISKPKIHHIHVEDEAFEREITLAIYTEANISQLDERTRKLIEKDE